MTKSEKRKEKMSEKMVREKIANAFLNLADAIESGSFQEKPLIGIAVSGTEHGLDNIQEGVRIAETRGFKAVIIDGEDSHKRMEEMLENGEIQGAVTMHYPFPIGVSTIGRVVTPGRGKEMFLAATTGTSATERVEAMVRNTIYGIIAAKACGISKPTVGIANIDGARQTEKILKKLSEQGYEICFAESSRADGGVVMRGNDLLEGTADVMVMDALTGNLMMKIFSAYTTGGQFESLGFGYGPGIGENYHKTILIVSRASGAPVIAGAIQYAAELLDGNFYAICDEEFKKAYQAGLEDLLSELKNEKKDSKDNKKAAMPPKETVTHEIHGIEVIDLEDAAASLWEQEIYAETGMGCTGPVILVNESKASLARQILTEKGYIV